MKEMAQQFKALFRTTHLHFILCNISFYVSRYNPQTATERRINRMPSCRQEIPMKIKPVGKTTVFKCIFDER